MEQPSAEEGQQPLTFAQKLRNSDRYWSYKMGLRALLCVAMLIGVGTTAWLLATAYGNQRYFGYIYSMDYIVTPFVLPVVCVSCTYPDRMSLD